MSATPRTMRAVVVPSAPRFRRVPSVRSRPVGTITLFLAATCILGVTSLCYVWQAGQRTAAALQIQSLTQQLQTVENAQSTLTTQINRLESYGVVIQAAKAQYGLQTPNDQTPVYPIRVPGPTIVITRDVVVPAAAPAATVRVAATDASVTSWWQQAWIVLYKLLR